MSKYVKDLLSKDISRRLEGVDDAVLVNVIGIDANSTVTLRRQLRDKDISLLVVKSSLAQRATEGTPLATAFNEAGGPLAIMWGGEDFVSLSKEVAKLNKDTASFEQFKTRGGVMDGECLTADKVTEISKWPTREEQLSLLMGQVLSAGGNLVSQITAPGGALASQIEKKSEESEENEESE